MMADFLSNLVARITEAGPTLRPRPLSIYEGGSTAPDPGEGLPGVLTEAGEESRPADSTAAVFGAAAPPHQIAPQVGEGAPPRPHIQMPTRSEIPASHPDLDASSSPLEPLQPAILARAPRETSPAVPQETGKTAQDGSVLEPDRRTSGLRRNDQPLHEQPSRSTEAARGQLQPSPPARSEPEGAARPAGQPLPDRSQRRSASSIRPALPPTPPLPSRSERADAAPSIVQVSIGRIEVRLTPSANAAPDRQKSAPTRTGVMTLEDYLRQRNGGQR